MSLSVRLPDYQSAAAPLHSATHRSDPPPPALRSDAGARPVTLAGTELLHPLLAIAQTSSLEGRRRCSGVTAAGSSEEDVQDPVEREGIGRWILSIRSLSGTRYLITAHSKALEAGNEKKRGAFHFLSEAQRHRSQTCLIA